MNKVKYAFICALLLVLTGSNAQDIRIENFSIKSTDISPRVSPVYDNRGEACALLRFFVPDTTYLIQGNFGVIKRKTAPGEISIYVPRGTKRLTIRHDGMYPLEYDIPIAIESKCAYQARLLISHMPDRDISITRFERHPFVTQQAVLDKSKKPCAKIRFSVPDEKNIVIKPNLGIRKKLVSPGDISIYVPQGTSYVTVKSKNKRPLDNYELPEPAVAGGVYDAIVHVNNMVHEPNSRLYAALGYNVINVTGPSLTLGTRFAHNNIELGAVLGIDYTGVISDNPISESFRTYYYKDRRFHLRYGYDVKISDYARVIPMAGLAFNYYYGHGTVSPENMVKSDDLHDAYSWAATIALRLELSVNKWIKVHITPEYNICIKEDMDCSLLGTFDNTFSRWNTGLNLNVGLAYLLEL